MRPGAGAVVRPRAVRRCADTADRGRRRRSRAAIGRSPTVRSSRVSRDPLASRHLPHPPHLPSCGRPPSAARPGPPRAGAAPAGARRPAPPAHGSAVRNGRGPARPAVRRGRQAVHREAAPWAVLRTRRRAAGADGGGGRAGRVHRPAPRYSGRQARTSRTSAERSQSVVAPVHSRRSRAREVGISSGPSSSTSSGRPAAEACRVTASVVVPAASPTVPPDVATVRPAEHKARSTAARSPSSPARRSAPRVGASGPAIRSPPVAPRERSARCSAPSPVADQPQHQRPAPAPSHGHCGLPLGPRLCSLPFLTRPGPLPRHHPEEGELPHDFRSFDRIAPPAGLPGGARGNPRDRCRAPARFSSLP